MKGLYKRLSVILLAIILTIISLLVIIKSGNHYTAKIELKYSANRTDNMKVEVEQDEEYIKLVDYKIENDTIYANLEAVNPGRAYLVTKSIDDESYVKMNMVYVHKNNVISWDNYFGSSTNDIVIPISSIILLTYIDILVIMKLVKNIKKSMYQYKNIGLLGVIIFLSFGIINQVGTLFNYEGLLSTINEVVEIFSFFSIILAPIGIITSILITISNIVLIKKEGFGKRNILGLIMGIAFIIATITPIWIGDYLQTATFIDVHYEQGIGLYLEKFIKSSTYIVISYIECILLGTVILSLKAAKHIPKYNKDYILILGCQIKKDGTLTNLLKSRTDRAIEFAKMQKSNTGKEIVFVPSGGKGNDEVIAEGEAIKNYLVQNGIKEEKILVENKSKNTYENIKLSKKLIDDNNKEANIAFSTTNYHVFRAGAIANDQNVKMEGIGAKTKAYFWINAFIREFIATIYSNKNRHFINILYLVIISLLLVAFLYYSNVIKLN